MNLYLVKFWPFYQPSYTFPIVQRVGSKSEPFENEAEYLEFLSNDLRSKYLWVDHQDLQVVANIYQMKIHILTVGVEGMEEPKARWTHLDPDRRLEAFKEIDSNLVGDMWLLHKDSTHFDLIIKKTVFWLRKMASSINLNRKMKKMILLVLDIWVGL